MTGQPTESARSPARQAGGTDAGQPAWVGLGANLPSHAGDPAETLSQAVATISALPGATLLAASSRYRSSPVDSDGPQYCNQVIRIRTTLGADALLRALQDIEQAFGRQRPYRNAPRTLDLDLLLYADEQRDGDVLTLPHPRMHERLFVLMPLAEIDPDIEIPGHGRVSALLATLSASTTGQFCEALPAP
ncbi:MAG: 2-amino-4-hydroxy-6-hydroxymethyldihydropteridine diphosphokinase [Lautropia sp.]|nr:2-amino-4-hydroxy-6-hydroxymethyldihydropteridine diphosphokinase [Lautropia sp.]